MATFMQIMALLGVAMACVFAAVCTCAGVRRKARASDCLIVLGAKVRPDGRMSNTLRYRCERALKAWEEGVAWNVIVCGGRGKEEPEAESGAMRAWLVRHGVPEERIKEDAQSSDTRSNLLNARKIMAEHGWRTAAVVTSDYHVQRALWLARDMGMKACGIAARSPRSIKSWTMARLRETASWALYGLRRIFA